jgi:uncharacterized protein YlxW (UPF0749 family)
MTRPIHSLKHIKASYKKIQILVFVCLCVTLIAVFFSAISSFHLGSLGRRLKTASAREINAKETALTKKLASTDEALATLKEQLKETKETIKNLRAKNASLQKKLTAALESGRPKVPAKGNGEIGVQPETIQDTEPTTTPAVPETTPGTTDTPPADSSPEQNIPAMDTEPEAEPENTEAMPSQETGLEPQPNQTQ